MIHKTTQPDNWYDYENGKWANIKTSNEGLEAYWVWIPRYEYIKYQKLLKLLQPNTSKIYRNR